VEGDVHGFLAEHRAQLVEELTGWLRLRSVAGLPEAWWRDRPMRLWVARRLYDYRHLAELRGTGTRPWVLVGDLCGRGPDNEPLVRCRRPVAWISDTALREALAAVEEQGSDEWGPLDRRTVG
jgi:hypothetical protein